MSTPSTNATMRLYQPFHVTLNGNETEQVQEGSSHCGKLLGQPVTIIQKNKNNISLTAQNGCIISQPSIIQDIAKAFFATGCTALALATSYLGIKNVQPQLLKQGFETLHSLFNFKV